MSKRAERPAWFKIFGHLQPVAAAVPDEAAGRALKAALAYFESGERPEGLDPMAGVLFAALAPGVEESFADFRRTSERNRVRAEKRWQKNHAGAEDGCREMPRDAGDAEAEAETEAETEAEAEAEAAPAEGAGAFLPPTPREAGEYLKKLGKAGDGARFVDYYASRGWTVGNHPMTDWRAALRNWARREADFSPKAPETAGKPAPRDDSGTMEQVRRLREKMRAAGG